MNTTIFTVDLNDLAKDPERIINEQISMYMNMFIMRALLKGIEMVPFGFRISQQAFEDIQDHMNSFTMLSDTRELVKESLQKIFPGNLITFNANDADSLPMVWFAYTDESNESTNIVTRAIFGYRLRPNMFGLSLPIIATNFMLDLLGLDEFEQDDDKLLTSALKQLFPGNRVEYSSDNCTATVYYKSLRA